MTDNIRWGLDNPHPFSQMQTELIWKAKYDEYGNRRRGISPGVPCRFNRLRRLMNLPPVLLCRGCYLIRWKPIVTTLAKLKWIFMKKNEKEK